MVQIYYLCCKLAEGKGQSSKSGIVQLENDRSEHGKPVETAVKKDFNECVDLESGGEQFVKVYFCSYILYGLLLSTLI